MKKKILILTLIALPLAALAVITGCSSSDPVALEGDEILIFPVFTEADIALDTFTAFLRTVVQDPNTGVRREGVLVLFRVTDGEGIFQTASGSQVIRPEVSTNEDGEAWIKIVGRGNVTVEARSGTSSDTVELSAEGGSVGESERPQAELRFTPSDPNVGQTVTFDASGSSDPDGFIDTWQIVDFGDGQSSQTFNFDSRTETTHVYSSAGSYDAVLLVTDNDDETDEAIVTVTVAP